MEGLFLRKKNESTLEADAQSLSIKLLAKDADMEIMTQHIDQNAVVLLCPAADLETMEFFFIHKGSLEIVMDGETRLLEPGDSMFTSGLKEDVLVKAKEDSLVLYVSNRPVFAYLLDFEKDHTRLLDEINEKDHYTHQHSRHVMKYSVRLCEALREKGIGSDLPMQDMIIAALFHDIGKCYVPDEILKKKGKLSPAELRPIYRHPIDSGRLLKPFYGERIAEIAANHHERLDGSGYPYGLTADEISFESKILAVADSFDAMTSNRGYNEIKSFTDAVEELRSMTDKFDRRITDTLGELVANGTLFDGISIEKERDNGYDEG